MSDALDDRQRLALARFLLGEEMAGLPAATRDRALLAALGAEGSRPSREDLAAWLERAGLPEMQTVLERLRAQESEAALEVHTLRSGGRPVPPALAARLPEVPLDAPVGWAAPPVDDRRLGQALSLLLDLLFLDRRSSPLPETRRIVEDDLRPRVAALLEGPAPPLVAHPIELVDALLERTDVPTDLAGTLVAARETLRSRPPREGDLASAAAQWATSTDPAERTRWLDALLSWPTPDVVPHLLAACTDASTRHRASLVLTIRFGKRFGTVWDRWAAWLSTQAMPAAGTRMRELGLDPELPLLVLAMAPDSPLAALAEPLRAWCVPRGVVQPAHFLERWQELIPSNDALAIAGRPATATTPPAPVAQPTPAPPPTPAPVAVVAAEPEALPAEPPPISTPPPLAAPPPPAITPRPSVPPPVRPPRPPEPPAPDPWRGFLTENANLLAGIAMLLVGGSLVAYFTWDRHWLFRYTLVPGMFAAFTVGLAAVARWLEKSDQSQAGTAAMLQGAAIALLPANCMSVSLLADDPMVTHKLAAVPAMAALYFVLLTLGLRRWCSAVHPLLGRALAPGLLFINALVLVRPLGRALARMDEFALVDVLTVGFYLGFVVIAEVLRRFVGQVLTRDMARQPRIPWFVGGILAITYLQVFVWVYAWERELPRPTVYGPLIVLAGGLAFHVERRFRGLLDLGPGAGEESFIGFSLILLGVLAGFASPEVRVGCLLLAGGLWLYQARFRSSPLHEYVGLLLLVLGGAAIGLLPAFPAPWYGALALAVAVGVGLVAIVAGRVAAARMREAAHELQQALLVLAAVVATLTQWHFRSEPLWTAALLGAVAFALFRRAARHDSVRDAFIAAMVSALVLPYLGFADMRGMRFVGNTLVLGLACLSVGWLAAVRLTRARLLLTLRSTVLFLYGALAVTAMAARVLVERQAFVPSSLAEAWPELLGPLLMLGVLVWATWLSRSMVPLLGGLAIVVAMLPALKANFRLLFPSVGWGTGYGSAVIGLLLLAVAFHLRDAPWLASLEEGDLFLGQPFPLRRFDHTLYTTPVLGTVLFLLLRVDTYSVLSNLHAGPPLKTAAAVVLTAFAWTLVGIWWRERSGAVVAIHAGMLALLAGLVLGKRQWGDPGALEWPLLLAGITLQLAEAAYRRWLVPRQAWARDLLAHPTRNVLRIASAVMSVGLVLVLVAGHQPSSLRLLTAFVLLQLARHGLREVSLVDGSLAVPLLLTTLLAETAPGTGMLLDRLSWSHGPWPLLAFAAAVQVARTAVARRADLARWLTPLTLPAGIASTVIAWALSAIALVTAVSGPRLDLPQLAVLLATLLLLARPPLTGPTLLMTALVAYTAALHGPLVHAATDTARARILADPLWLATFALAMAVATAAARRAWAAIDTVAARWLLIPSATMAVIATLRHMVVARNLARALPASYLATLALVAVAIELDVVALGWVASAALTLGNVHAVRLSLGDALRARGLSDVHLVALGAAATLAQAALLRRLLQGRAAHLVRQVTLAAAFLVLVLLSGNYAADPALQDITPFRFLVSGAMALAAGLFFRRAATAPEPDEEAHVGLAYAVYHFGLAMALWCLVLLVPVFRHPVAALPGLAIPAAFFLGAAERFRRGQDPRAVRYARSATVLSSVVLGLYAARPLFQLILFPDARVDTGHYHYNAPLVIALGLALLRLHAFESRAVVAWLGGAALMVGTWFGITAWPGLSPFGHHYPAAWTAVVLAHAFAWILRRENPARAWARRLGAIDDAQWERLATLWHLTAFAGALEVAMIAVSHPEMARYGWGALLAGVVAVLLHQEWQRPVIAGITGLLLAAGLAEAVLLPSLLSEVALLLVALGAVRVAPGPFVLIAALDGYLLAQHRELAGLGDPLLRWTVLAAPWRLGALSLALACFVEGERRSPRAAAIPFPVRLLPWLGSSAVSLGALAAATHTLSPALRHQPAHLWAPYLASAAHALVALSPGAGALGWSSAFLLALGNVHLLHHWLEPTLAAHGVFRLEEVALGVALMVAATAILRLRTEWIDQGRLADVRAVFAAVAVALLPVSYVVHGAIPSYGAWRGFVTGVVGVIAAEAMRARARRGAPLVVELAYHAAAAVAVLGFALSVPALRTVPLALVTASLPAFLLWARSELGKDAPAARARDSAVAASLVVLALWVSRLLFRAALFPALHVTTHHYHAHAAVVMILGLLLMRLHGRGAPYPVALTGAMTVIAGSYFGVTAWPGLSPFTAPLRGAWAAIVVVHLWTLATSEGLSVTALVRAFAGLPEEAWHRLRATAGEAAVFAAHVVALYAITSPRVDSHAVAPLLLGIASLLVHHGVLRARGAYFDVAAVEVLAALHVDAVAPSGLRLDHVVWVLLALRAVLLVAAWRPLPDVAGVRVARWGTVCAVLVVLHVVLQHRPWTTAGLVATLLLAVLTTLVPRSGAEPRSVGDQAVVAALLLMPTWLTHFASAPWAAEGAGALLRTEPLVRTLLALFVTALWGRTVTAGPEPASPRAFHQVRAYLAASGTSVFVAVLQGVSAATVLLLVAHYGRAYSTPALALVLVLLGGLSYSWYRRGRERGQWVEVLVAEALAGAAFGVLRRQLLLTTSLWTYEHDLWLSLAASALFTGAKQRLDRREGAPELRRPLTLSVLIMPALALFWTLSHHLGSDMVLLVVGLNTVMFAFLGHDRRQSPYNLVAVSGFVSFVLVVFWSKLHLRVLHAYVVPVAIGVLLLAQLFESELSPKARAQIRMAALGSMLASTGWAAVLDGRHPLAFNLTLLLLCLGCMAVGSLLRIRLYVALGLCTLLLDLASLTVKALARMESQSRMTWVGLAVFLLGAGIVSAAVYHKARRREIEERWERLRAFLAGWQ